MPDAMTERMLLAILSNQILIMRALARAPGTPPALSERLEDRASRHAESFNLRAPGDLE